MTTTAPPRPPSHRPAHQPSTWARSVLAPLAAGVATVCAASSLTGVVGGAAWLGYVVVAIVLVACTGLALRSVRTPTPLVGLAQLLVIAFLVTGVFTSSGILSIIPGPASFAELNDVLATAFEQIRTGLPPVEPTPPILCLVTIAIGLVAVLVDTLAVAAAAPAATGLVLLCVYAVPASLSDSMLPWWTFLIGAAAFAGMLAVDGNHRHRRWRNRDAPGLGASPSAASTPAAVVSMALVLGLVAGAAITAVGTVGRLPGSGQGGQGASSGGLGVNPFTSLRGMLDQGTNVELFRVRGLGDDKRLLRAFTLDTYRPNRGWGLPDGPMPSGYPADRQLPLAPGDSGTSESRQIQIEPMNWVDVWMPVYGAPRQLAGVTPGWYYDQASGAVFSERKQRVPTYTEVASLTEPSKDELRAARVDAEDIPPVYSRIDAVDPRVVQLTQQLVSNKTNNFDKATAIWQYFTAQNGFTYDTQTAAASDADALADFLFNGKRGFCEQFASAMAVMLRVLDIPARVAVGFTTGVANGDYRSITSQDAHAWVEVYFGENLGWVSFDPTPRSDGRGYIPPYRRPDTATTSSTSDNDEGIESTSASAEPATGAPDERETGANPANAAQDTPAGTAPGWVSWGALLVALMALALTAMTLVLARRSLRGQADRLSAAANWLPLATAAAWALAVVLVAWLVHWVFALLLLLGACVALAPSVVREVGRRRRLRVIGTEQPAAADAAWEELLDEAADRGVPIPKTDTVRTAAQKLAQQHHLDEAGRNDLRTVVGVMERSWYAPADTKDPRFASAFEGLRASLERNAPMSWRGRLFPKSLFRRRR